MFNLFLKNTPLWVKTPKGPDVEITLSYNSQDGLSQGNAFGNKWMFSYGSYVSEEPQTNGGRVVLFMPDGSQDTYYPQGNGQFSSTPDNRNRLVETQHGRFELLFPGGDKAIYNKPAGSQQPFLVELRDRWGYALTFGYNSQVQLTTITDAGGGVTRLQYNAQGKVSAVWDPFGRKASFSYDGSGNLIECVDMEGHAFQYSYDTVGDSGYGTSSVYLTRLNTAQGPWLFSHYYGYPSRQLSATDPAGQSETWTGRWNSAVYGYTDRGGASTWAYGTGMSNGETRIGSERFADGTTAYKSITPTPACRLR